VPYKFTYVLTYLLTEQVRLIDVTSETDRPVKPAAGLAPVYTRDEMHYYRICDGVLSLTLVQQLGASELLEPAHRLVVCSANDSSPMLVNIINSVSVQTLNRPANPNIGTRPLTEL